ncbi:MAG TPA: DUF1028 domain-containing protein [Salinarimonas sp.]|nr:DUF1028 domain-containing protein [Salinarimonas sp.]
MTWSIVARDPSSGHIGIVVASCAFAVGGRVPFIASGVGAVATQSFVNPFYGPRGLALMRDGMCAGDVVLALTQADEGRHQRQIHVLDSAGRLAAFTGDRCVPWCGHLVREGFSVAGNMLTGPEVIQETARVYGERADLTFPRRLLAAMKAGENAGGDKRGKQASGLLIHDEEDYPFLDIRVDDHADPLAELSRLEEVSRQRFIHYRRLMPSKTNPHGVLEREEIERLIAEAIAAENVAAGTS